MIKIIKGNEIKEVTKGVYENLFKDLGFEPIEEKKVEVVKEVKEPVKEEIIDVKKETVEPAKEKTVSKAPVSKGGKK